MRRHKRPDQEGTGAPWPELAQRATVVRVSEVEGQVEGGTTRRQGRGEDKDDRARRHPSVRGQGRGEKTRTTELTGALGLGGRDGGGSTTRTTELVGALGLGGGGGDGVRTRTMELAGALGSGEGGVNERGQGWGRKGAREEGDGRTRPVVALPPAWV